MPSLTYTETRTVGGVEIKQTAEMVFQTDITEHTILKFIVNCKIAFKEGEDNDE